ncbi:hypothetical protein ETD86_00450 [Nonomuraea turkmeniaca]|uniref:ABC transporter permease n=1 Tax=Nonomuraea turkmeniaca TaxID=103838 RepID=A0A5S4FZT7_9ACTN|nr:hypothetical protein [Nonomuraea turkmeniaca]TMR25631.1 hypothetical protein ETD86_00450 [Nonomuraea turkmeniaca]
MRTLAAEWIKFRTLRSSLWSLAAAVAVALAVTVPAAGTVLPRLDAGRSPDQASLVAWSVAFFGLALSALVIGVLGVITMTGEQASGMINLTYTAMPSRRGVLLAKAAVLTGAALVTLVLIGTTGYLYGRAVIARLHPTLLPPDAWPLIGSAALVLVTAALLGLALGALLRSGALAAVVLIATLYVLPFILMSIPGGENVGEFLPLVAGLQLLHHFPQTMPATTAFAVCALWMVAPIGIALAISPGPGSPS